MCLSSIGGQTTGPIMTKFGMHMRIDLGMVPTQKNWPPTQGAKIKKKNTKLDSKQTSNVPCQTIQSYVISTSFLSTDCELSINPCSKNVYNLGPRGVEVGVLGGSKNQKVREMSWTVQKINNICFDPRPGGVGGQHFKSARNFTNCRENR